jgi:DNA-binding MarR family transcriptional regulator
MIRAVPSDPLSKHRLKAWLRLLRVTRGTERTLREMLRVEHGTTLPRFDVLAALWRRHEGVTMSELSRMLLVSNGNATAVVTRLAKDGMVTRRTLGTDRRSVQVTLTETGLKEFEVLAAGHERAVARAFAALTEGELETLTRILARLGKGEAA